jgi:hypothetical protein
MDRVTRIQTNQVHPGAQPVIGRHPDLVAAQVDRGYAPPKIHLAEQRGLRGILEIDDQDALSALPTNPYPKRAAMPAR